MDMHHRTRCGLRRKLNSLLSTAIPVLHLTDLSNRRTFSNLLTSHLRSFAIPEAIHKCKLFTIQACRAWAKATLHQAGDCTQIKARSNTCKQQPLALSQELSRAGHLNLQDRAAPGAGQDSRSDSSAQRINRIIMSYEGMEMMSTYMHDMSLSMLHRSSRRKYVTSSDA